MARIANYCEVHEGAVESQNYVRKTHTHPFNGPFSGTTRVSRYQKGKTDLDFTEARDGEWQWHQLGRIQVCRSLQTDNHASIPPLSFITGRMPFLPPNQQRQCTEGNVRKRLSKKECFKTLTEDGLRETGMIGCQMAVSCSRGAMRRPCVVRTVTVGSAFAVKRLHIWMELRSCQSYVKLTVTLTLTL